MRRVALRIATLVCLTLQLGSASAATSSCPVSTSVSPFPPLALSDYHVTIVDGGEGDLDGGVDGACDVDLAVCLGGAECPPAPLANLRLVARGRDGAVDRDGLARLVEALGEFPGVSRVTKRGIEFAPEATGVDTCAQTRIRLVASARAGFGTRLRLVTEPRGESPARVGKLHLRCATAPVSPALGNDPVCHASGQRSCRTISELVPQAASPALPEELEESEPAPFEPTPSEETPSEPIPSEEPTAPVELEEEPSPLPTPDDEWLPEENPTPDTPETPDTAPTTPVEVDAPATGGRTFWISPSGSDSNSGTASDRPWKTFKRAISKSVLLPGDTIILRDGTYRSDTTGLALINCSSSGNAPNGSSSAPITIRAENERRAFLSASGGTGFEIRNCSWWNVQGLRAASADNSSTPDGGGFPFKVAKSQNVTLRRLLGSHNNRRLNTHIFAIEDSSQILVEECEAYYYHRHGFSLWRSRYVTVRRSYANSMKYGTKGCCSAVDNENYGDVAYVLYGTSDSTVENCISDYGSGYNIVGIPNPLDPSGRGGRNNHILGSISLNDDAGLTISSRYTSGAYHNALGNVVRDFVATRAPEFGIYLRGVWNNVVENVTLYKSGRYGLMVDSGDPTLGGTCGSSNPQGCSFTARNVLSLYQGPTGHGLIVHPGQDSWNIERSNSYGSTYNWAVGETVTDSSGHVRYSRTSDAGPVGFGSGQCVAWIPAGSPMKGAGAGGKDIGANVVYRYQNRALTGTRLWDGTTGKFPCGAVVSGVNSGSEACANVHTRLNVNTNGCWLP